MARLHPSLTELSRAGNLLSTPLKQISGLRIIAHCGDVDCPAPCPIPVGEVLAARGNAKLGEVARSFRCTACSRPAQAVSLREEGTRGGWILQPVLWPDHTGLMQ